MTEEQIEKEALLGLGRQTISEKVIAKNERENGLHHFLPISLLEAAASPRQPPICTYYKRNKNKTLLYIINKISK